MTKHDTYTLGAYSNLGVVAGCPFRLFGGQLSCAASGTVGAAWLRLHIRRRQRALKQGEQVRVPFGIGCHFVAVEGSALL